MSGKSINSKQVKIYTDFHGKERAPNFLKIELCFHAVNSRSAITQKR